MKNFLKLLTLSAFIFSISGNIGANTYGSLNTYHNDFFNTTTTTGYLGNNSVNLTTSHNDFFNTTSTYGTIGSYSYRAETSYNDFFDTSTTYIYIH